MTGFARLRKSLPEGELVLSIKSVNHRGLDIHFRVAPEIEPFENAIRSAIKQRVARGHLQVQLAFTRSAAAADGALNRPLLESFVNAFRQAARDFKLQGEPDLNIALQIPGMLGTEVSNEIEPSLEPALVAATEEVLKSLNAFREREGAVIASEMRAHCASILELVTRMEKIRAGATSVFQKRLEERMKELLRDAALEPQRVAQEAALLAERSDISEELVRLKTHAGQLQELLNGGGEIGKKTDFLLQEMNRETNTILSKTGGLGELGLTITDLALTAKAEIDKIREQSLNLE